MKITGVSSEVFEWERPGIWNGGHFYGPGRLHKVTVETDEGLTGYGWNGGTAAERPLNLFPGYVDFFRPLLLGRDPMDTRAIATDLGDKLIKILGPGGINTQVLAAINIACWDIKGKALGESVHQLLGGAQWRAAKFGAGVGIHTARQQPPHQWDSALFGGRQQWGPAGASGRIGIGAGCKQLSCNAHMPP